MLGALINFIRFIDDETMMMMISRLRMKEEKALMKNR